MKRALVLAAAILALAAAPARASCINALIVDGRLLVARGAPAGGAPPAAGSTPVVKPACNDAGQGEPDRRGTATRLRGVPPNVGVVSGGTLYVPEATLVPVRGHPLRSALRDRPPQDRGRCRPHRTPLRGRALGAHNYGLAITAGGKNRNVLVDGRTRIEGAPPAQRVIRGQRLAVRTSLCEGARLADRVTFLPPILEGERIVPDFDREPTNDHRDRVPVWMLLVIGAPSLLLIALAGALLRRA